MSDYLRACSVDDIPDTHALAVVVDGVPVVVVRNEGEYYALDELCSHAAISLAEGEVEDGEIECWLHGSRFDLVSGRPTSLPAVEPVHVYPVKLDGDDILVDVAHPSNAHDVTRER